MVRRQGLRTLSHAHGPASWRETGATPFAALALIAGIQFVNSLTGYGLRQSACLVFFLTGFAHDVDTIAALVASPPARCLFR